MTMFPQTRRRLATTRVGRRLQIRWHRILMHFNIPPF